MSPSNYDNTEKMGVAEVTTDKSRVSSLDATPDVRRSYSKEINELPTVAQIAETVHQTPHDREIDNSVDQPQYDRNNIDRGLTAWLVVLGAWCSSFCSYGWINSKFTLS